MASSVIRPVKNGTADGSCAGIGASAGARWTTAAACGGSSAGSCRRIARYASFAALSRPAAASALAWRSAVAVMVYCAWFITAWAANALVSALRWDGTRCPVA